MTTANTLPGPDPEIRYASTPEAVGACFDLMKQLRPHLTSEREFVERWQRQRAAVDFRLLAVWLGQRPVALAAFRIQDNMLRGPHVYVDDLVTDATVRSGGYGGMLIERLKDETLALGCSLLVLDTPMSNFLGHRFYYRHGLNAIGLHFTVSLR
jgi:GNAT superfamily N-acetyltransferase